MSQRLRIFISSPGDVPAERLRADLVIDKLGQDYARYFNIESYRWEHEPMLASGHFQDAIEPPSEADIVIMVLWSRLGTPLPEKTSVREYHGIDGRVPVTGTEWEFEDALAGAQARGAPDIMVFRNVSPAPVDSCDLDARARSLAQLDALDALWKRYFVNRGVLMAASCEYTCLEEFAARLEESLRKLIERRIKALASGSGAASQRTWLGDPFRGLQSYEFEHAAIFFGRDALVAKAIEQLAASARQGSAFLLVVGASGSGKSSLVKGAVVPRLMKPQRIEGVAFLRRAVFRPADAQPDLFLGLVEALTRQSTRADVGLAELLAPGQTAQDLADHLRATATSGDFLFTGALARVTTASRDAKKILPHETAKLILVIDQFEELFTLPSVSAEDRTAFVKLLSALARSGAIWTIATMRADFWHRVLDLPDLIALAETQGRLDVPPPSPAEIAEMIRKPTAAAGLRFQVDPESGIGLDSILAEDAANAPGVLPLISFTLESLYAEDVKKRGQIEMTFAQYRALGGLEGAIATRAEEVVAGLPAQTVGSLPRVLRALATIGDGDGEMPVSRTVPLSAFAPGSDARAVVDALVAGRLLVASNDGATATLRFAHEALISRWARAQDQLANDRRDLQTRALVERHFSRWRTADPAKRKNLLLRDPDLANALDLKQRMGSELSDDLAVYIERSQQFSRRRHQLLAAAAMAFGVIALAATGFGILAYRAQQLADRETSRAIAAEASAVKQRDEALRQRNAALITQSRYLASEADQLVDDGNVRGAIALLRVALPDPTHGDKRPLVEDVVRSAYNALYSNRELGRMEMPVGATAIATDGHAGFFVIATADRIYLRKGVSEANQLEITQTLGAPERLVLSEGGSRLAMIGRDGGVSVWDLNARRQIFRLPGIGSGVGANFLRGTDRLLVHGPHMRSWILLDASSGRTLATRRFAPGANRLVSLVDGNNGVIAVIADGKLHRLSSSNLTDLAMVPVEPAEQYALADTTDGKSIYVAAAKSILDGRIFQFSADTLSLVRSFGKFTGGALFLDASGDAKLLALHGIIGIDFFDLQSGERMNHFVVSGAAAPRGQFISSDEYIAYGPEGFIRRYLPKLGTTLGAYRTIDGGSVVHVDEFPDKTGFATISDRPSVTLWSFKSETTSREYSTPFVFLGKDMKIPAPADAFAISSDHSRILFSYLDHSVRLWNPQTGASRLVRKATSKAPWIGQLASLSNGASVLAEKDGHLLVYTQGGGTARPSISITTGQISFLSDVGGNSVLMISASGAASLLDFSSPTQPKVEALPQFFGCVNAGAAPGFALCIKKDGSIAVLRTLDGRIIFSEAKPSDAKFTSIYVSPAGDRVAISDSRGRLAVYSLPDRHIIAHMTLTMRLEGQDLRAAADSPLLSDADRALIRTGAQSLDIRVGANFLHLSPDNKILAIAMPNGVVRLIDLVSGKRRQLGDARMVPQDMQFSENGRLLGLIEKGQYELLDVYEVVSGVRIARIALNNQVSPRLVALANGRGFATIDKSGRLIIHPVFENNQDLIEFLARRFPEQLTAAQRRAYFIE